MTRPARYTENGSSRDWIDEFCATSTTEEVRGAFRFTIGKYLRRYGKKDDPLQEALKIQDYANRLVEFERSQMQMPADFGQQHTIEPEIEPFSVSGKHTIEPASLIDDEQAGLPGANELHDLARVAIDEGLFWVPWCIGNCPFDEDKMICVLLADTTVQVQKAGKLEWHNASDPRKVVAYSRHTAT